MELNEAIERIKELQDSLILNFAEEKELNEAIDTVLKELDIYKGVINKQSVDISKYLQELDKKDKENKQLKNDNQILKETLFGGNVSEEI